MVGDSVVTDPYECPVCGYQAESEVELREHFELKAGDDEHDEYDFNPKGKEIVDEDSVGTPAGTPGHPGIDEGSQE